MIDQVQYLFGLLKFRKFNAIVRYIRKCSASFCLGRSLWPSLFYRVFIFVGYWDYEWITVNSANGTFYVRLFFWLSKSINWDKIINTVKILICKRFISMYFIRKRFFPQIILYAAMQLLFHAALIYFLVIRLKYCYQIQILCSIYLFIRIIIGINVNQCWNFAMQFRISIWR